jgi:hypothetical protein
MLSELNYPKLQYKVDKWAGSSVTCADIAEADYAVVMFRCQFSLDEKPEQFIVHVSADNRYKLHVNGILASMGPQLSDWRHWRYETMDIAPCLQKGSNVIAAEVVNWGPDRHFGIMSLRTAFMMQGATEKESAVNTVADGPWKAKKNDAYNELAPNWIFAQDVSGGLYATNPGEQINVAAYPENWTLAGFDDSAWKKAKWLWGVANEDEGGGFFWLMKPRTTPQVEQTRKQFKKIARSEGVNVPDGFISGREPLAIPARSKVSLLFDYEEVSLGFPELVLSGGKGSTVTIRYAENLFNPDRTKGDRSDIEGKIFIGIRDLIIPDGRGKFLFSPTWYRAFRYVQIEVETAGEPLVLHEYYNMATMSPLKVRAVFDCDNPEYKKIDEICRRTVAICNQDNLMSDAYYEQMMYVGDTWIHALINLYMTGDDVWMRNAIEQFDYSRMPDGNILSCYPLRATFIVPTYTLVFVDMLYDFMMYCDDREFLRKYIQSVRSTVALFENSLSANGLVNKTVNYFVDWYADGEDPGNGKGDSAVVTFYFAATLLHAAALFDYLGLPDEAAGFRAKAEKLKKDVIAACWDEKKQMFAERPDKKFYDERTNIIAVAAQVFDEAKQKELFVRCLNDKTISKPGYYFTIHSFNVIRRLGIGEHTDKVLQIWKDLLPLHLTTTPEYPDKPRSDAHPWSASPIMAFINIVAGIAPAEPAYKSVSIEPALGPLSFVKASYPHYLGDIKVDLKKKGGGLEGSVELPKGLKGIFRFNGKTINLNEGVQTIS